MGQYWFGDFYGQMTTRCLEMFIRKCSPLMFMKLMLMEFYAYVIPHLTLYLHFCFVYKLEFQLGIINGYVWKTASWMGKSLKGFLLGWYSYQTIVYGDLCAILCHVNSWTRRKSLPQGRWGLKRTLASDLWSLVISYMRQLYLNTLKSFSSIVPELSFSLCSQSMVKGICSDCISVCHFPTPTALNKPLSLLQTSFKVARQLPTLKGEDSLCEDVLLFLEDGSWTWKGISCHS